MGRQPTAGRRCGPPLIRLNPKQALALKQQALAAIQTIAIIHGLPPRLRRLLHSPLHQLTHTGDAARQACWGALCAAGRAIALPHLRASRAACGVWRANALGRDVRHQPCAGLVVLDATGEVDAAHLIHTRMPAWAVHRPEFAPAPRASFAITRMLTMPELSAFAGAPHAPGGSDFRAPSGLWPLATRVTLKTRGVAAPV